MTHLKKLTTLYDEFDIHYNIEKFAKGEVIHDFIINDEIVISINPFNQPENSKIYGYHGFYTVLIFSKDGKFIKQMILV